MSNNPAMTRLNLFTTPVIQIMLEGAAPLNARLKKLIYAQEAGNDGLQKSNQGGWHSKDDMMGWAPGEAKVLLNAAMGACAPHTADTHPSGKRNFEFNANMWANINRRGHANKAHTHPGCLWSCVYYVDGGIDGDSAAVAGELMLEDPRYPMNAMYVPSLVLRGEDGAPQHSQYAITPKSGMMVIFPSWLRHSVRPYHGGKDRISVAFNLMIKEA